MKRKIVELDTPELFDQVVSSEDAKKINEARKVKKLFPMNYPSGWKDFKVKQFKK